MHNKITIGIDPGFAGGICVLNPDGSIQDLAKMPETPQDIFNYLKSYKDIFDSNVVCYLENVGHGIPGQSSSATAKFARHNGHLEMALTALSVRTIMVTPQKWQKHYQLGKSSDHSKHEWKNILKQKAQQLFPNAKVTLNTADALLIAEYGRNTEK